MESVQSGFNEWLWSLLLEIKQLFQVTRAPLYVWPHVRSKLNELLR